MVCQRLTYEYMTLDSCAILYIERNTVFHGYITFDDYSLHFIAKKNKNKKHLKFYSNVLY